MRESLDEPISVVFNYDAPKRRTQPHRLTWNNQDYLLGKVDFHHKTRSGTTLIHHFSLADVDSTVYFKLALDTDTLHWKLEEYMYGGENSPHYGSESSA